MPKCTDRLPGQLAHDQNYLNWYHRSVKGKTLCGKILDRMIHGGKDNIQSTEEEKLWKYYKKHVVQVAEGRRADKQNQTRLAKKEIQKLQLKLDASDSLEAIFPDNPAISRLILDYFKSGISQFIAPDPLEGIPIMWRLVLQYVCEDKEEIDKYAHNFKPFAKVKEEAKRFIDLRHQIEQLYQGIDRSEKRKSLKNKLALIKKHADSFVKKEIFTSAMALLNEDIANPQKLMTPTKIRSKQRSQEVLTAFERIGV